MEYALVPGGVVEVPLSLAQTYFGYQLEDKEPSLARLGWVKFTNDIPAALERLAAFKITPHPPETRRSLSPATVRALPVTPRKVAGSVSVLDAAKA